MGGRGASSATGFAHTLPKGAIQGKLESFMRRSGSVGNLGGVAGATAEQRAAATAAYNLAVESVFGSQGHAEFGWLGKADDVAFGYRTAHFKLNGRYHSVQVSPEPSSEELRGAAALVYQLKSGRASGSGR